MKPKNLFVDGTQDGLYQRNAELPPKKEQFVMVKFKSMRIGWVPVIVGMAAGLVVDPWETKLTAGRVSSIRKEYRTSINNVESAWF